MSKRSFDPTAVVAGPYQFSLSGGLLVDGKKPSLNPQGERLIGVIMLERGDCLSMPELAMLVGCNASEPANSLGAVLSQAKKALRQVGYELPIENLGKGRGQ